MDLALKYQAGRGPANVSDDYQMGMELLKRLKQLQLLLSKIEPLTEQWRQSPQMETWELEMFVEHFYYVANRMSQLCDDEGMKKPEKNGLGLLKSGRMGVNLVRNTLLEHPECTMQSFALGECGPVIKPLRQMYSGGKRILGVDAHESKGLYKDAQELADKLEAALLRVLAKEKAPVTDVSMKGSSS